MNERIRELMRESGVKTLFPGDPGAGDSGPEGVSLGLSETQKLEKFAELIVRECASKCEFVANMATITNTGEMARKTKATADSCATMIKQHFGVEE